MTKTYNIGTIICMVETLVRRQQSEAVRAVVDSNGIKSDNELAESTLSCLWYPGIDFPSDDRERYETEQTRSRVYVLRNLADWLYKGEPPKSLVEICSAGTTQAPLAFPETIVYSVDHDIDHFKSNTNNSLPREAFEILGRNKSLERLREGDSQAKKEKLSMVRVCLPNFRPLVADGTRLPLVENAVDIALILGQPHPKPFMEEMTRVIKPGGFIVISTEDRSRPLNASSSYDTNRFGSAYSNTSMVKEGSVVGLGLVKVTIPASLRKYEDLATYQDPSGKKFSTGFVFQVFRKKALAKK